MTTATIAWLVVFTTGRAATTSQELPPGIRWSVSLTAAPSTPPVIGGDRIFLGSLPGIVAVYDAKDGRELWREAINPQQPIVPDGELVFVASGETIQALQIADRAVVWRATVGTVTAPLLVKEGWVIAAFETRLVALRASDGTIVWQRDAGLQRHRGAIDGNTLFVPLATGRIQAVDLANGAVRWETPLGGSPAEPLVVGDRLYVGATDKKFYCLKTSNGDLDWPMRVGASIGGRPATDGERVFFVGLDNLIRGINRGSGALVWQEGIPYRPFGTLAVADKALVVAGQVNEIRLLNVATGKQVGNIQVPERLVSAPAVGTLSSGEAVIAVVTGGLNESWKLWLASPAEAGKAKSEAAKANQLPSK